MLNKFRVMDTIKYQVGRTKRYQNKEQSSNINRVQLLTKTVIDKNDLKFCFEFDSLNEFDAIVKLRSRSD